MRKIFSGEVFFALFLLSGVFKESLGFPVDLAAVFLVLTTLSILFRFFKKPEIERLNVLPISIFVIFVGLVLLSFFYTPNLAFTSDKTIKLITLTAPAFVYPFFLFKTKESLTRFLVAVAVIATIMAFFSLPMIFQRGSAIGFVGFNEGNYQGLGRVGGIGLVILMFLGLLNSKYKKYRLIFFVSVVVVSISLLASGARMPIIAVAAAIMIIVLSSIKIKDWEIRYPKYYNKIFAFFIVLLIPLIWAYNQGYFNSIIYRFEVLRTGGGGESASARSERFNAAMDMFNEKFLLGHGFGSFGDYYTTGVNHDYPHNLFLELLSELGMVGFLIFGLLLLVALYRFYKSSKLKEVRNSNLFITVAMVSLVIFINVMVSGDINGNRMMLTFISIMCLLPLIFKNELFKAK